MPRTFTPLGPRGQSDLQPWKRLALLRAMRTGPGGIGIGLGGRVRGGAAQDPEAQNEFTDRLLHMMETESRQRTDESRQRTEEAEALRPSKVAMERQKFEDAVRAAKFRRLEEPGLAAAERERLQKEADRAHKLKQGDLSVRQREVDVKSEQVAANKFMAAINSMSGEGFAQALAIAADPNSPPWMKQFIQNYGQTFERLLGGAGFGGFGGGGGEAGGAGMFGAAAEPEAKLTADIADVIRENPGEIARLLSEDKSGNAIRRWIGEKIGKPKIYGKQIKEALKRVLDEDLSYQSSGFVGRPIRTNDWRRAYAKVRYPRPGWFNLTGKHWDREDWHRNKLAPTLEEEFKRHLIDFYLKPKQNAAPVAPGMGVVNPIMNAMGGSTAGR